MLIVLTVFCLLALSTASQTIDGTDFALLCSDGIPLLDEGDKPKLCSPNPAAIEYACPNDFWCHIGSSNSTYYCCPRSKTVDDPCQLPPSNGFGTGKMRRWFYDSNGNTCRNLTYTGYGGNQNNFLTRDDCQRLCYKVVPTTPPFTYPPVDNTITESTKPSFAPTFTHPPGPIIIEQPRTTETTTRVPMVSFSRNPMTPKPRTGTFPPPVQTFRPSYTMEPEVEETTQTNTYFGPTKTQAQTTEAPREVTPPTGWPKVFIGQPSQPVNQINENQQGGVVMSDIDPCEMGVDSGMETHGREPTVAFHWNLQTLKCHEFAYKGSGGNLNNFQTVEQCDNTCGPGPMERSSCLYPTSAGTGSFKISRWTYNLARGACQPFFYTGFGGTSNRFVTFIQCQQTCELDVETPREQPQTPPAIQIQPTRLPVKEPTRPQTNTISMRPAGPVQRPFKINTQQPYKITPTQQVIQQPIYNYIKPGTQPMVVQPGGQQTNIQPGPSVNVPQGGRPINIQPSPSVNVPYGGQPINIQPTPSVNVPYQPINVQSGPSNNVQPGSQPINLFPGGQQVNIQSSGQPVNVMPGPRPNNVAAGTFIPQQPAPVIYPQYTKKNKTVRQQQAAINACRSMSNQQSTSCGQTKQCSSGTFCQVGSNQASSVCCPNMGVSPCTQPLLQGSGTVSSTRWGYNPNTGRCITFMFRGIQGNQNNFQTYDRCMQSCGTNPCGSGSPYKTSGQNLQCSSMTATVCPSSYYCHVGPDTLTSVCCPVQGNPCNLPIARGNGQAQLQRWAFSTQTKNCQAFIYTGVGGNQNNFLTQADCQGMCSVTLNPCSVGQPAVNNGQTIFCSTANMNICPANYFCHIGTGAESTVCCPKTGSNSCQLSLATGTGNGVLARWYFEPYTSTCKAFTYTGISGNENNFLSLADCRRVCPEYDNPCPAGNPPINSNTGQVSFCSATNTACPTNHWCHIGNSRQTSVCCPFPGNPCTMPKVVGTGFAQLPRYFYNSVTRKCEVFTYSGKGGNQNNFLSKAECEGACPIIDNPCTFGMPAVLADGSPQLCSVANAAACPTSYWCHVGSTAATTLCCPGAGDPCRMVLAKGSGQSVINRWYYNSDTKTCLSFTYSGRGGNQNNFMSLTECRLRCPEFQNPCSTGQPHIGLNGQITHCGATTPSICPTTYWCHVGATLESSVCCPGAGNSCELPLATGNGNSNLLRYYYDQVSQSCRQFQYTGFGGNQNNFMTVQACEQRCPVFRNPCAQGDPARGTNNQVVTCTVSNLNGCPTSFWCHIGGTEQTTLCCPGSSTPCTQPLVVGTGRSSLPRFYYNSLTQQCLPYTYSGIGGNQNNFLSRADCQQSCPIFANPCVQGDPATGANGQYVLCSSTTPNVCPAGHWCHIGDVGANSVCCPGAENPCLLPLATGTANSVLPRWYFDSNVRRCTRFTYTGRGGNQNNFQSMQDCQLRCPEFQNPCSSGSPAQAPTGGILFCSTTAQTCPATYWCHVGDTTDSTVCCPGASNPCLQSMIPGTGSSKLNRWYFNQNTRQCVPFTYTGRGGNQNNYLSEAECMQRCPVFQNPCSSTLNPPQIVFCTAQSQDVCPAGYWCHVGPSTQTSVCCPGSANPCSMSLATGAASALGPITRWYFDPAQRLCRQFQYSGLGGNQNNFLTREQCQQKCPEFINPCINRSPYRNPSTNLVLFCNLNSPADCPAGYWCHVGANQQSTVCCSGISDPCTSQLSVGNGPANLPRWYFNRQNRQCQQFTYTGIGGNQNSFITQRACQLTCPEFTNPCDQGSPLTQLNGQITYCSAQNPNICPLGYFCHVGVRQETTVCCPGATNPCNLPQAIGRDGASLQRYYFNQLIRKCVPFTYSGAGGNANNFLTLQSCRAQCPEFDNPCGVAQPYRSTGGQILYCNTNSVCPPNYYCHYGTDSISTVCCPAVQNPCNVAVIIGTGTSQLTRYYYNSALRTCVSFVYSGIGGNQNNFRTMTECQARCQPVSNPCASGNPFTGSSGMPISCGSSTGVLSAVCPTNYYCHVGVSVYTTVCCPVQARSNSPCALPMSTGLGEAKMTRWFFDRNSGRCRMFTYMGAAGNENNFQTQTSCSSNCANALRPFSKTKVARQPQNKTVTAPPMVKKMLCPQGEPLMSTNGAPVTCSLQTLSSQCPHKNYVCNVMTTGDAFCCPDPKTFCLLPRDPGSCQPDERLQTRYGYNPATDTCVPFKFTGCAGNLNNFASQAQCSNICCNKGYNLLKLRDMPHIDSNSTVKPEKSKEKVKTRRQNWWDWIKFW